MMKLTLADAAERIGMSKSTLLRAIRGGELSAERKGDRTFVVEASELFRFRDARATGASDDAAGRITARESDAPDASSGLAAEIAAWRVRAELLERMLTQERETSADLRARLDRAGEAIEAAQATAREVVAAFTRQLPAPLPEAQPVAAKGILERLLGR